MDVAPGSPNLIERVEGGLLSYGNEFTLQNNPLECGFESYCSFDDQIEYIGQKALSLIKRLGPSQQIRGIKFDGPKCPPCSSTWPLLVEEIRVGYISTAIWSPRLNCNVALGMLERDYWNEGQAVTVSLENGTKCNGEVVELPFT